MMINSKTVGLGQSNKDYDEMDSLKRESIQRMKTAMLSADLDSPTSAATAIKHVTILRVYHQVSRIIQYLDLMDKLETKLYNSIDQEIDQIDFNDDSNFQSITKLLVIQEKLQKSVIESHKLLQPYLEVEQYPAFDVIEAEVKDVDNDTKLMPSEDRNLLRDNAGQILKELSAMSSSKENVSSSGD